jgi:hypothetical protein
MSGVTLPTNPRFKNLKGIKFGRLSVVEYAGQTPSYHHKWRCVCECGNSIEVYAGNLIKGPSVSCGCYQRQSSSVRMTTHGDTDSTEYRSWRSMINRCNNVNVNCYEEYGGRGISVCDQWKKSYTSFLKDMGRKPTAKHSIDRIDSNANYTPENCRWATPKQQARNTRRNRMITYNGETRCLAEWAEILGFNYSMVSIRVYRGWTFERAITTPKQGVSK